MNGRPITTQRRNSAGTQIGRINRAYDPHGRLATLTDDRNGTSTWQYYTTDDLVRAVVTPPSGTGVSVAALLNARKRFRPFRAWKRCGMWTQGDALGYRIMPLWGRRHRKGGNGVRRCCLIAN